MAIVTPQYTVYTQNQWKLHQIQYYRCSTQYRWENREFREILHVNGIVYVKRMRGIGQINFPDNHDESLISSIQRH